MKVIEYLSSGEVVYDKMGQKIWLKEKDGNHVMISDVRGWGRIQNMFPQTDKGRKQAGEFQDSVGEFIVQSIKEKLLTNKQ